MRCALLQEHFSKTRNTKVWWWSTKAETYLPCACPPGSTSWACSSDTGCACPYPQRNSDWSGTNRHDSCARYGGRTPCSRRNSPLHSVCPSPYHHRWRSTGWCPGVSRGQAGSTLCRALTLSVLLAGSCLTYLKCKHSQNAHNYYVQQFAAITELLMSVDWESNHLHDDHLSQPWFLLSSVSSLPSTYNSVATPNMSWVSDKDRRMLSENLLWNICRFLLIKFKNFLRPILQKHNTLIQYKMAKQI